MAQRGPFASPRPDDPGESLQPRPSSSPLLKPLVPPVPRIPTIPSLLSLQCSPSRGPNLQPEALGARAGRGGVRWAGRGGGPQQQKALASLSQHHAAAHHEPGEHRGQQRQGTTAEQVTSTGHQNKGPWSQDRPAQHCPIETEWGPHVSFSISQ